MGFDYDKIKKKEEEGAQWASYSDLFMVLSFIFLLLYVTANLRSGTFSVQKSVQFKILKEEAEDLKEQIKVYNALKDDYVEKKASNKEQAVYKRLMGKLDLLQEERKEEASELRQRAADNERKEEALNEYQRIIRNIINTNMLAKSRIKKRDSKIKENKKIISLKKKEIKQNLRKIASQDQEITKQSRTIKYKQRIIEKKKVLLRRKQAEIKVLEKDIVVKKKTISSNKRKISSINKELSRKIRTLKKTQRKGKLSKRKLKKDIAWLKHISKKRVSKLRKENKSAKLKLRNASKSLVSATKTINKQDKEKKNLDKELRRAAEKLARSQKSYKKQIDDLKGSNEAKLKAERIAFKQRMNKLKISSTEKARRMKKFKEQMKEKEVKLANEIKNLAKENTKNLKNIKQLAKKNTKRKKELERERLKAHKRLASIEKLKVEKSKLKGESKKLSKSLKNYRAREAAKKQLSKQIRDELAKAGIKTGINGKTGEVTLSFGKEFFSSGRATLKPGMRKVLQDFIPRYARSLYKNKKIANRIKNVEIIGHASPTYGGKYVNPSSLSPQDQKAIRYNLDLSINRAKAIFDYIFDTRKMSYKHQKKLRSMVKVTGRGFFSGSKNRMPAQEMSQKQFCKKFNCKKAQTVIIKFNLKE